MSISATEQRPQTNSVHLLPAPDVDNSGSTKLDVNSEEAIKFDVLGPMVINSDGTISRIANWDKMTEDEKQRTMRVLNARNQIRLKHQREAQGITQSS